MVQIAIEQPSITKDSNEKKVGFTEIQVIYMIFYKNYLKILL